MTGHDALVRAHEGRVTPREPAATMEAPGGRPRPGGSIPPERGRVDFYSSHPHYADHMQPIWDALGEHQGVWHKRRPPAPGDRLTLVSSFGNLIEARRSRPCGYMEHGAGFTYVGGGNPFAGGPDRDGVVVFLNQNERVHQLNGAAHPGVVNELVGTPKMDPWFTGEVRAPAPNGVVAFSFHWDYRRIPEARSAYAHYRRAIPELARRSRRLGLELIGHGHPRAQTALRQVWARCGIRFVPSFSRVLELATLYVVDTSSTAYEWAATGRPVLSLNAPWYRRNVSHGLRFWEDVPGLQVDEPEDLEGAVLAALEDPPDARALRARAVDRVFPLRDGDAAGRAAAALIRAAARLTR